MKKGISLIVLVITIIVMIIIAGAIIISLNSTSIIEKANTAVTATDVATINHKLALAYADLKATYPTTAEFDTTTTYVVSGTTSVGVVNYYTTAISEELSKIPAEYGLEVLKDGTAQIVKVGDLSSDRLNAPAAPTEE